MKDLGAKVVSEQKKYLGWVLTAMLEKLGNSLLQTTGPLLCCLDEGQSPLTFSPSNRHLGIDCYQRTVYCL